MDSVQSGVSLRNFGHRLILSYLFSQTMCEKVRKIIARTPCIKEPSDPITFLKMMIIFRCLRRKLSLIFFNLNPFHHRKNLHFGILNFEKQHKDSICKVLERSVLFSAFHADFCLCPK